MQLGLIASVCVCGVCVLSVCVYVCVLWLIHVSALAEIALQFTCCTTETYTKKYTQTGTHRQPHSHTQHTYTHRNIYTNTHTFMQIETHTHSQGTLTQIAAKLITKCARVFNVSKLLLPLSYFLYLPLCLYPCTSPFPCLFFFFYFLQYANGKCQQAKQSSKRPLEMK